MSFTAAQLVAPDLAAFEADMIAYWQALGLEWPNGTRPGRDGEQVPVLGWSAAGIAEFNHEGARVMLTAAPTSSGDVGINIYVNGDLPAGLFDPALASPDLGELQTNRGTLTLPKAANGTRSVRPETPNQALAGLAPPPPAEGEADYQEPDDWQERTPGAANGYALGVQATWAGARWLQAAVVPPPDPIAKNGGNYYEPGTLNSGWVKVFQPGEIPAWEADTQYLAGQIVSRPNGNTYRAKVDEYAQAGREPENPVMHAVWALHSLSEGGGGDGPAAWGAGQSVSVSDQRTHGGRLYAALQAHTTQLGWEPPNVPALWQDIGPAP